MCTRACCRRPRAPLPRQAPALRPRPAPAHLYDLRFGRALPIISLPFVTPARLGDHGTLRDYSYYTLKNNAKIMMKITLENSIYSFFTRITKCLFFLTIKVLTLVSFKSKISKLKGYKVNF